MRGLLGLPLALTLVLALAGPAMASDYMLPVLVPQQAAPAPAPGEPSAVEPAASSFTPVSASPLTVLAALVGALAVTALTFVALGRSDRRPLRRA